MWNVRYDTNELIYKTETDSQLQKTKVYGYQRGKGGRYKLGVWDQNIQTTIYKINNKVLLYSTGNYIQYLVIHYNGKESGKEYIYI